MSADTAGRGSRRFVALVWWHILAGRVIAAVGTPVFVPYDPEDKK